MVLRLRPAPYPIITSFAFTFLVLCLGLDLTCIQHQKAFVSSPSSSPLSGYPPTTHPRFSWCFVWHDPNTSFLLSISSHVGLSVFQSVFPRFVQLSLPHITIDTKSRIFSSPEFFSCKNSCSITIPFLIPSVSWGEFSLEVIVWSLKPSPAGQQTLNTAAHDQSISFRWATHWGGTIRS